MSEGTETASAEVATPAAVDAPTAEVVAEAVADPSMVDLAAMGDKLVEVTIDGQKVTMPLAEVVANTQRAKASHKRFVEAAEMKKQLAQKESDLMQFVEALRGENPEYLLQEIGIDTQSLVQREMQRMAMLEAMTPRERDQHEMKSEREQLQLEKDAWEKKKNDHRSQKEQEMLSAEATRWQEKYTNDFTEALGSVGISPQSTAYPKMLEYMAQIASEGLEAGVNLEPADLVQMAQEEWMGKIQGFLGGMEAENLHKFLGEGVGKKFRQYDIERLKGRAAATEAPRTPRRRKKAAEKKTYNIDEMRALLRQRRMGG